MNITYYQAWSFEEIAILLILWTFSLFTMTSLIVMFMLRQGYLFECRSEVYYYDSGSESSSDSDFDEDQHILDTNFGGESYQKRRKVRLIDEISD